MCWSSRPCCLPPLFVLCGHARVCACMCACMCVCVHSACSSAYSSSLLILACTPQVSKVPMAVLSTTAKAKERAKKKEAEKEKEKKAGAHMHTHIPSHWRAHAHAFAPFPMQCAPQGRTLLGTRMRPCVRCTHCMGCCASCWGDLRFFPPLVGPGGKEAQCMNHPSLLITRCQPSSFRASSAIMVSMMSTQQAAWFPA